MNGSGNTLTPPPAALIPVHIYGTSGEGTSPELACLYSNDRESRTYRSGTDFTIEVPLGSMFFVSVENASQLGYTPSLSLVGVDRTWDYLTDSESYFQTMSGYIVTDPNGEHYMRFDDH